MAMTQISLSSDETREFAALALEHFIEHPEHTTFAKGELTYDSLFAVRWGMGGDCAVVFTIGSTPIIYTK